MDWRILIVALPLLLALGWVAFNIGALALQQVQGFLDKSE
ncbi:MAG: photosystem II protein Y [Symploca sp. SIO2C1]|nr:photosystem II protein Y [Symploca sp. SIO2C1]